MTEFNERPSSMEIEQIRAEVPRGVGFGPALLVIGVIAIFAFTVCVPRGGTQEVTLPIRSSLSPAGDPLGGRVFDMITVIPRDRIPAIINPFLESAEDAAGNIALDEPIIGIEINGDARAYSTFQLSRHEIVNDVVGGIPIAVTW